jgi:hypothetical protein
VANHIDLLVAKLVNQFINVLGDVLFVAAVGWLFGAARAAYISRIHTIVLGPF